WESTLPVRQHLGQIDAGDVLHHQKLPVTFVKVIADTRQSRVMKPRQKTCFALKLLAQFFIGKKRLFERDNRIQTLINGFVNRAHAALSKLPHDAITALENCSFCQHCRLFQTKLESTICPTQGQDGGFHWY